MRANRRTLPRALGAASLVLLAACTTNTNSDDTAPVQTEDDAAPVATEDDPPPVPPEGAAVLEGSSAQSETGGPIVAYVVPGNEVQAGQELTVTMVTNQCATPLFTLLWDQDLSMLTFFAEDAAAGDTLTVAIPDDFQLGSYQLLLDCVNNRDGVPDAFIAVVAATDQPVEVTDRNRPANYCRIAKDRITTDCLTKTPVPSAELD